MLISGPMLRGQPQAFTGLDRNERQAVTALEAPAVETANALADDGGSAAEGRRDAEPSPYSQIASATAAAEPQVDNVAGADRVHFPQAPFAAVDRQWQRRAGHAELRVSLRLQFQAAEADLDLGRPGRVL
jgi:hypothetical protein